MKPRRIEIVISFPALSDLVAYLRESDQVRIDDAAAKVDALTDRLSVASSKLDSAVTKSKGK